MNEEPRFLILNGELVASEEALVSPQNRGMMYGDGCFETFRADGGKFLHLNRHLDRMQKGLKYLGIEMPFSRDNLKEQLRELLKANKLDESVAMLRIQCWRKGNRGYTTTSDQAEWIVTCLPVKQQSTAMSLITVSVRAIPDQSLSRSYKLSNGLNYIQAAREAQQKGGDDALMLSMDGHVSESSSMNIFWLSGNTVYTPSEECDLLPGITRETVITIIREMKGMSLVEGAFHPGTLMKAECAWLCNSVRGVIPVKAVDGQKFDTGHAFLTTLQSRYDEYRLDHLQE